MMTAYNESLHPAGCRVTLEPAGNDTDAACPPAPACETISGFDGFSACQLALPCTGNFTLRACTAPGAAVAACSAPQFMGRNASAWAKEPWSGRDEPKLLVDPSVTLRCAWWGI